MNVWRTILSSVQQGEPCVLVSVASTKGSAPRDEGAHMVVTRQGYRGTIGGGTLEWRAIAAAQLQLAAGRRLRSQTFALGPDLGQCCGGRVELSLDRITALPRAPDHPQVLIFGAGHVGRALARALRLLPLRPILIDQRAEELALACGETRLTPLPEAEIRRAPFGTSFVILTHDHALDFLIAAEALKRPDAAYVGMIGSKTKRATFRNWLSREIGHPDLFENLVCPIGGTAVKDKRPAVIATLAASEIMTAALTWSAKKGLQSSSAVSTAGSSPSSLPISR